MAFTARNIIDRLVQFPMRFKLKDINTGAVVAVYDLEAETGTVTAEGTALNKTYLQPVENEVAGISDGTIKTNPISHASTGTGYGVGTEISYGHVALQNSLNQVAFQSGLALSGNMGKVLNDSINSIERSHLMTIQASVFNDPIIIDLSSYRYAVFVGTVDFGNGSMSCNNNAVSTITTTGDKLVTIHFSKNGVGSSTTHVITTVDTTVNKAFRITGNTGFSIRVQDVYGVLFYM